MPDRLRRSSSSASRRAWRRTPWTPATRSGRRAPRRAAGGGATTTCACTGIVPRSSRVPVGGGRARGGPGGPRRPGRARAAGGTGRRGRAPAAGGVARRGGRRGGRRMFAEIAAEADAATAGIGDGVPERGRAGARVATSREPRSIEGVAALDAALDAAEAVSDARAGGETALPGRRRVGPRSPATTGSATATGSATTGSATAGSTTSAWSRSPGRCSCLRCARRPSPRARVPARPPPRRCGRRSPAAPRIRKRPSPPRCWRSWPCCTATGRSPTSLCNGPRPRGPGTASRRPCAALRRSASGRASCGAA